MRKLSSSLKTREANKSNSNVAEIFKTPGKLRGKTPRTVRKINAGEARIVSLVICSAILT